MQRTASHCDTRRQRVLNWLPTKVQAYKDLIAEAKKNPLNDKIEQAKLLEKYATKLKKSEDCYERTLANMGKGATAMSK